MEIGLEEGKNGKAQDIPPGVIEVLRASNQVESGKANTQEGARHNLIVCTRCQKRALLKHHEVARMNREDRLRLCVNVVDLERAIKTAPKKIIVTGYVGWNPDEFGWTDVELPKDILEKLQDKYYFEEPIKVNVGWH